MKLIFEDFGIPYPPNGPVNSAYPRSFEAYPTSSVSDSLPEYAELFAHNSDLARCEPVIRNNILPIIHLNASQGHHRVRIYIVPNDVNPTDIASDVTIGHESYPVSFFKLDTKSEVDITFDFLIQPEILRLIRTTIMASVCITSCIMDSTDISIRRENDFGLFESTAITVVQLTVKIV